MKLFLLTIALFSFSGFAKVYRCEISRDQLGPNINMDLTFEIYLEENGENFLTILGEKVAMDCQRPLPSVLRCKDPEGMPHTARVINDAQASLSIGDGIFLPETDGRCELN